LLHFRKIASRDTFNELSFDAIYSNLATNKFAIMLTLYAGSKKELVYSDEISSPNSKSLFERFALIKNFYDSCDHTLNVDLDMHIQKDFYATIAVIYGHDPEEELSISAEYIFDVLGLLDASMLEYEFWTRYLSNDLTLNKINLHNFSDICNLDLSNCFDVKGEIINFFKNLLYLKIGSICVKFYYGEKKLSLPKKLVSLKIIRKTKLHYLEFPESLTALETNFNFDPSPTLPKSLTLLIMRPINGHDDELDLHVETSRVTTSLKQWCPVLQILEIKPSDLSYGSRFYLTIMSVLPESLTVFDTRSRILTVDELQYLPTNLQKLSIAGIACKKFTCKATFYPRLTKLVIDISKADIISCKTRCSYDAQRFTDFRDMLVCVKKYVFEKFLEVDCPDKDPKKNRYFVFVEHPEKKKCWEIISDTTLHKDRIHYYNGENLCIDFDQMQI
jgi:hypothetical protein